MPINPHTLKTPPHSHLCAVLLQLPGMAWAQESLRWAENNRFVAFAAGQHQLVSKAAHFLFCLLCFMGMTGVHAQSTNWAVLNRTVGLSASALQQDYREIDTQGLTATGTLNTERGTVGGLGVQGRWQGQLGGLPLWAQADAHWAQGQTAYDGYLQSGSTLTPFKAKTGNTWRSQGLAMGVPLTWERAPNWQAVPFVQWASQYWQRNLVQYGETYRHSTRSLGLLVQWQVAAHWLLETSHHQGSHQSASLNAPALGFVANLGLRHQTQNGLALRYRPDQRWSLQLQFVKTIYSQGASAVVNNLQAPPSTTRQTQLGVGLVWHY